MAWAKLENPKPAGPTAVGPDEVKGVARGGPHNSRLVMLKLGSKLCERASLVHPEHKVHIMAGSSDDAGKVAVVLDDTDGKFTAKRKPDGRYDITINARAAAGIFSTEFPPFKRVGSHVKASTSGPLVIVFAPPTAFFA